MNTGSAMAPVRRMTDRETWKDRTENGEEWLCRSAFLSGERKEGSDTVSVENAAAGLKDPSRTGKGDRGSGPPGQGGIPKLNNGPGGTWLTPMFVVKAMSRHGRNTTRESRTAMWKPILQCCRGSTEMGRGRGSGSDHRVPDRSR